MPFSLQEIPFARSSSQRARARSAGWNERACGFRRNSKRKSEEIECSRVFLQLTVQTTGYRPSGLHQTTERERRGTAHSFLHVSATEPHARELPEARYSYIAIRQSWKWTYKENGQDVSSFCDGRFSCFAACRFSIPWQLYWKETNRKGLESILTLRIYDITYRVSAILSLLSFAVVLRLLQLCWQTDRATPVVKTKRRMRQKRKREREREREREGDLMQH